MTVAQCEHSTPLSCKHHNKNSLQENSTTWDLNFRRSSKQPNAAFWDLSSVISFPGLQYFKTFSSQSARWCQFTNSRFCSLPFLPREALAGLVKPAVRDLRSTDLPLCIHSDRHWHSACSVHSSLCSGLRTWMKPVFSPITNSALQSWNMLERT